MHGAVAALQMAAHQLQLSNGLDRSKYGRIISQLRAVRDELHAFERRAGRQKADPVNLCEIARNAMATAAPNFHWEDNRILAEDVLVEGPPHDLHDLLCGLIQCAVAARRDAVELRMAISRRGNETQDACADVCAIELLLPSPDLPDFLRRKLWDVVGVRRGEVSVVSEPERCSVGLKLPIERRRAAAA